jgi:hypothetical protein
MIKIEIAKFLERKNPPPLIGNKFVLCEGGDSPFGLPPGKRRGKPKGFGVVLFTYK